MDERNLPELLRTAERRVNQHVWGDRRAIVSIPARLDADVDLLLLQAADEIESLRGALQKIAAFDPGQFRPLEDEIAIWRLATEALAGKSSSSSAGVKPE